MTKLTLTATEKEINKTRRAEGFKPYTRLTCEKCGTVSPFRTKDELAASGWTVYFSTKCPADNK